MAKKELTRRISIPVSQTGDADLHLPAAVRCRVGIHMGCNWNHQHKKPEFDTANANDCGSCELQGNDEERRSVSFDGDIISLQELNWMNGIASDVRWRLLLAIEPISLDWRKLGRLDNPPQLLCGARQLAKAASSFGIVDDFCVRFSLELLKKLHDSKDALLILAKRSRCLMYVRKTLLLRGTRHTKTFTKYFMCRVFGTNRKLLAIFYRQLENLDVSFRSRYQCKQNLPRVTLVPNRTVPENTALRMTRERLHRSDDYFGKMPLRADTYLTNMAARLTRNYINTDSLLARRAVKPVKPA